MGDGMAIWAIQNIAEVDIMVQLYEFSWYLCVIAMEGRFSIIYVLRILASISELCSITIWQLFYSGFSILATEFLLELKKRQWPSENNKSAEWDPTGSLNFINNKHVWRKFKVPLSTKQAGLFSEPV